MSIEKELERGLKLQSGDILILEMPCVDSSEDEYFPVKIKQIQPIHTMLWIKGNAHPVAHSVRAGFNLPGVRLTKLPSGNGQVFRYKDSSLMMEAANILRNWALTTRYYSKEDYLATYPPTFWLDRNKRDLLNFFSNEKAIVSGPSTPYLEPRATYDLMDLARDPTRLVMGDEGLRRAIKFASRRNTMSPESFSKGQRCTATLVAAYQAAILAPIVKLGGKITHPFKQYKGKAFEEYANDVLIEGWRDTEIGKKLLQARTDGDYVPLFTKAFAVDQRYVTPNFLYKAMNSSDEYTMVGQFSYFDKKLEMLVNPELSGEKSINTDPAKCI